MADLDLLETLQQNLAKDAGELNRLDSYYRGRQPLSFLAPQIAQLLNNRIRQLVVNWPRLIVKSVARRCYVEGFRLGPDAPADDELWLLWQASNMDKWSHLAQIKALAMKRAYVTVWSDEDGDDPVQIAVESPRQMTVHYEPGGSEVTAAGKFWRDGDLTRGTLYLPDRIVKYAQGSDARWAALETLDNPLEAVPVVPLVNEPDIDDQDGESELVDVIPLADAINKLATDMMVSAEFHAMPRRWAVGVDLGGTDSEQAQRRIEEIRKHWEAAYPSKFLLAEDSNTKFGQFDPASLSNFIDAIKLLATQVAALAGLPPHYLGLSGDNPASADAIRSAEASLVERAEEKQRYWSETWEQVMRLAARVRDGVALDGGQRMETIWRNPATPTVAQKADAAVKLVQAEIIDVPQAQEDLGYSPVQIDRMADRRDQAAAAQIDPDTQARMSQAMALIEQGIPALVAFAAVGLIQPKQTVKPGAQAEAPPSGNPIQQQMDAMSAAMRAAASQASDETTGN